MRQILAGTARCPVIFRKGTAAASSPARKTIYRMSGLFLPDYMFDRFDQITPDFLASIGVRSVLVDIDNTLAPYEVAEPNQRVIAWIEALRARGITIALMSNNNKARVHRFNRSLRLPAYYDCKKPSTRCYIDALKRLGRDRAETCVIGDQIFTDVLVGKRLGLRAILVPPIHDQKTLLFRIKRFLEKPFLFYFKRQQVRRQYLQ